MDDINNSHMGIFMASGVFDASEIQAILPCSANAEWSDVYLKGRDKPLKVKEKYPTLWERWRDAIKAAIN